jgi:tetratricopeptide (TPR) repeat protein
MAAVAASAALASPAPAGAKRRYPGVRSFEERDQAQFRGRQAASEELLLRVLSVRLLLQFAPSGVGKTSLLAAGLFPRLRRHNYFPFIVRLNQPEEPLLDAVRRSLAQAADEFGLVDPVISPQADSLWSLLAGTQLWSRDLLLLCPVLVFDQFEEIFTLRDAAFRADFAQQVGELTDGAPRRAAPPPAKFIISLREEYLGKLEEFSASIPELFRERLRLTPLSSDEAREAIAEPAALVGDDWASPPLRYSDDALDLLIDFIDGASESVKVIEPLTLQLVCHRAENIAIERRAAADSLTLGVHDFGGLPGLERLVREYYQQVLGRIAQPGARRCAQLMFEEGLLDPAGKRLMLEQGEIEREYSLDAPTLDALVASSLLRREPRNESVFYEISHDRLTDTIARHRKPRLPRWVKPTLSVGALIVALATFSWWQQRSLTAQASSARYQAERAVGQLLGEKLVSRLREAGLSDALRQILEQTNDGARDDYAAGLATVLQWRHKADIERERGTLDKARQHYERALAELGAVPNAAPASAQVPLIAERARIVTSLGALATDAGEVTVAGKHLGEAQRLWDAVLQAGPSPQELLDAADSHLAHVGLHVRVGDYDGAEMQALAAARLATQVWSKAYDGRHGIAFETNFDTGRAMQVFADSALGLSISRDDLALFDSALKLSREAVRLRPLSFQARKQFGTAIAQRFISRPPSTAEQWQVLQAEARRQFDDLGQADADNLSMRRDRAALELAIAQVVATCIETPKCRPGVPVGAQESARVAALESTGTFRQLATADLANRSRMSDVAWGLGVQSRLRAIDGDPAAATLLDGAIALYGQVRVDGGDFSMRSEHANSLLARAKLLAKAHRPAEVKDTVDRAWAEIDGAPADNLGARSGRINLLATAVPVLREAGLTKEANALQAKHDALEPRGDGPRQTSYAAALKFYEQAIELMKTIDPQDAAKTRAAMFKIESLQAQAVTEYPFDAAMWDNLRQARSVVVGMGAPTGDAKAAAAHDAALRSAVAAAWMANVLEPNARHLRQLYEARRGLAMHLRDRGNADAELLALTERGLAEAKELVRQQPDTAVTLTYLADASLGVGFARESHGAGGWDEAFRVAFLQGERLARMEPNNAERQLWLGSNRSYVAGLLDRDKRAPEAAEQRQRALASCRAALALRNANAKQREQTQSCLKDLADAGVK